MERLVRHSPCKSITCSVDGMAALAESAWALKGDDETVAMAIRMVRNILIDFISF
jgi:hypothetical protein